MSNTATCGMSGRTARTASMSARFARFCSGAVAVTLALVLLQHHGPLLHLDFPHPTKGLKVHFAYGGCGIRRVNVVDIASSRRPGLSELPASAPTPSIGLRFDGWDAAERRRGVRVGARARDGFGAAG